MKLENQVCTLEQAHKLQHLGIVNIAAIYHNYGFLVYEQPGIAMFNVAELGVMLPAGYDTMQITGNGWVAYDLDGETVLVNYKTEAECRAALLINLLEMKQINHEECNKRLLES